MARITTHFCLAGLLLMLHVSLPLSQTRAASEMDLSSVTETAVVSPELNRYASLDANTQTWNALLAHPCRFSDRFLLSRPHRSASEREYSEFPAIGQLGEKLGSNAETLRPQIQWGQAVDLLNSQTFRICSLISDYRCQIGAYSQRINAIVDHLTLLDSTNRSSILAAANAISLDPNIWFSGLRPTSDPEPPFTAGKNDDRISKVDSAENLFQLDEDLQDSYWQYYEDCDRWGVEFADQFLDVHTESVTSYANLPTSDPSAQGANSPLWRWWTDRSKSKSISPTEIHRFLRQVEFNLIETAETDYFLVDHDSQIQTGSDTNRVLRDFWNQLIVRNQIAIGIRQIGPQVATVYAELMEIGNVRFSGWNRWVENIRTTAMH